MTTPRQGGRDTRFPSHWRRMFAIVLALLATAAVSRLASATRSFFEHEQARPAAQALPRLAQSEPG